MLNERVITWSELDGSIRAAAERRDGDDDHFSLVAWIRQDDVQVKLFFVGPSQKGVAPSQRNQG